MKRNDFIRNSLMALAISLVPKILLPQVEEPEEEKQVKVTFVRGDWHSYSADGKLTITPGDGEELFSFMCAYSELHKYAKPTNKDEYTVEHIIEWREYPKPNNPNPTIFEMG